MLTLAQADLALELQDLQRPSLDAGVSEADAGTCIGSDLQAEGRRGRQLRVAQEGPDLLDGQVAIGFDLVLDIENDLGSIVLTEIDR